ncbi:unnamed protein product [Brassicogethes aeneus]|uniref:Extracellular sulfatase C-terminal domain-containing protein n=1 Tax=Brassicogethes aeneus TaxID=1431903 RepID=A0A9P0B720_BRAAE|nr:unnamed protein product [Brassicogethes aeneus]
MTLTRRQKRDTLTHVENAMEDVRGKIYGLRSVNATFEKDPVNLETNSIGVNTPKCVIRKNVVNCSNVIYHNKKTWRQSRLHIDTEIQQLKQKLETLKYIRKHLKRTKPSDVDEDEDDDDDSEEMDSIQNGTSRSELPAFNELNPSRIDLFSTHINNLNVTKINKRKRKRPLVFDELNSRPAKRRKYHNLNNPVESENTRTSFSSSTVEFTTRTPYTDHTNPHRHQHKLHHVTQSPYITSAMLPKNTNAKKKINNWTTKVSNFLAIIYNTNHSDAKKIIPILDLLV